MTTVCKTSFDNIIIVRTIVNLIVIFCTCGLLFNLINLHTLKEFFINSFNCLCISIAAIYVTFLIDKIKNKEHSYFNNSIENCCLKTIAFLYLSHIGIFVFFFKVSFVEKIFFTELNILFTVCLIALFIKNLIKNKYMTSIFVFCGSIVIIIAVTIQTFICMKIWNISIPDNYVSFIIYIIIINITISAFLSMMIYCINGFFEKKNESNLLNKTLFEDAQINC